MWLGEHHRNWALAALIVAIGAGVAGLGEAPEERQFRNSRGCRTTRSHTTQVLDSVYVDTVVSVPAGRSSDSGEATAELPESCALPLPAASSVLFSAEGVRSASLLLLPVRAGRGPPVQS